MSTALIALFLFALFILLIVLGIPIGFSLGISGFIGLLVTDQNLMMFAQTFLSGIMNFAYLAIPFFVLLGIVMERAKISKSLVAFADELVGYMTGGLAMGTIIACAIFAAISGSGPATVAAIGTVAIPEMVLKGYSQRFATAATAAGGILGPIIPLASPSLFMALSPKYRLPSFFWEGSAPGFYSLF